MSGFKLLDDSSAHDAPDTRTGARQGRGDEPLGLTVHSLPTPEQSLSPQTRRSGRWKMFAVFLVCAAPVLASYFTYYVVRPEGRRNFGELIEPQRPLPDLQVQRLNGTSEPLPALKGQWLLLSVAGGACEEACQHHLYLQRQLRESLGKDRERLDWVWLIDDDAPVSGQLLQSLKGATVLRVPAAGLSDWLVAAAGHQLAHHLYLVDPMGNWMMRFPARLDLNGASRAKRDLERLLRASASWDKAGREPHAATAREGG